MRRDHDQQLDRIERKLNLLLWMERIQMAAIDDLRSAVAAERTVTESVVVLLNDISQRLKDAVASGDQTAIKVLADELGANTAKLADAVTANTPTPTGS